MPRNDCRVREASGDTGVNILGNNNLLECAQCGQLWELCGEGGNFTHWDKLGRSHYGVIKWSIESKWPKGESQCESVFGGYGMKKKFKDAER